MQKKKMAGERFFTAVFEILIWTNERGKREKKEREGWWEGLRGGRQTEGDSRQEGEKTG